MGIFPIHLCWLGYTNESFMDGAKGFMDFFKFRASWGQNGNHNITPFQYLGTIGFPQTVKYSFGDSKTEQVQGAFQEIVANPEITWETSEQLNIGLDARFLGSRLGLAFDYYTKSTKDWLVIPPILESFGTNPSYANGGVVE